MSEGSRQLRALENAAAEAERMLEARIATVDGTWGDDARRSFEANHLAAIRSDARRLRVEVAAAASSAVGADRLLDSAS